MMEALVPLFVAIPLIAAFLVVILGKLVVGIHRWLAPLTLLALLFMALHLFIASGGSAVAYSLGGWGMESGRPVGIFMVLDGFSVLMVTIINLIGFIALKR
jgi:formate hydrogenlyase subunit 3/multisubunit Na+/H+ antiporter MnhD subunit